MAAVDLRRKFAPRILALADDGEVFTGPARITIKTPLSRLPHFVTALFPKSETR